MYIYEDGPKTHPDIKRPRCESCGKHPAFYYRENFVIGKPPVKICCVCHDKMTTNSPDAKEYFGLREIPMGDLAGEVSHAQ